MFSVTIQPNTPPPSQPLFQSSHTTSRLSTPHRIRNVFALIFIINKKYIRDTCLTVLVLFLNAVGIRVSLYNRVLPIILNFIHLRLVNHYLFIHTYIHIALFGCSASFCS